MSARARCPICGSDASFFSTYRGVSEENALEVALFGRKSVFRCAQCGHGFCSEPLPPDALGEYYRGFWSGPDAAPLATARTQLKHALRNSAVSIKDRLVQPAGSRGHDQLDFPPLRAWLDARK